MARGLIRGSDGNWISGFSGYLGRVDILFAELYAIHQGLCQISRMQLQQVIVYPDSAHAVSLVRDGMLVTHLYAPLIQNIKDQLSSLPSR